MNSRFLYIFESNMFELFCFFVYYNSHQFIMKRDELRACCFVHHAFLKYSHAFPPLQTTHASHLVSSITLLRNALLMILIMIY